MNNDCIIIFTKFYNLPVRENKYTCVIHDGSGKIVENTTAIMNVQNPTWQTWTKHDFNPNFDEPGTWKFELYVNDAKIVEKTIEVTPFVAPPASAEAGRVKYNYLGIGISSISHSEQYYGGSYAYAIFGRQLFPNVLISLQYSCATTPFFGTDAFLSPKAAYYFELSRKEKMYAGLAAVYRNDLSGNDPGSIGLEISPMTNGLVNESFSFSVFPIEWVYNLENKSSNFSFELFKLYFKF
jgi:hypothetical protein